MDVMYSMGIGLLMLQRHGTFHLVLNEEFMFYDTALLLASFLTLGAIWKPGQRPDFGSLKNLWPAAKNRTVIRDSTETEIAIEEVIVNDIVLVKPGEKVPVDGWLLTAKAIWMNQ